MVTQTGRATEDPPKIVSSVTVCSWNSSLGLAFGPLTKLGILGREGELPQLLVMAGPCIPWESHPSVFGTRSWLWLLEMIGLCYVLLWSPRRLGSRDHMFTSVKSRQWFVGTSVTSYLLFMCWLWVHDRACLCAFRGWMGLDCSLFWII